MKHLKTIFFSLLLIATASFFSACEDDGGGGNANSPAAYSRIKTSILYDEQEQEAWRIEYSYDAQGHIIKCNVYKLIENYGLTIYGSTSSYDSKGREIESKSYYPTPNGNGELCGRTEYSYPSDNLVEIKSYEIHNSVENLEYSRKYSINGRTLTTESYNGDGLISNKLVTVFRSSDLLNEYYYDYYDARVATFSSIIVANMAITMDAAIKAFSLLESLEETQYYSDGSVRYFYHVEYEYTHDSQGRLTEMKGSTEPELRYSIDYAANTINQSPMLDDGSGVYGNISKFNTDGLHVSSKFYDDNNQWVSNTDYEYGNKELTIYETAYGDYAHPLRMKYIYY